MADTRSSPDSPAARPEPPRPDQAEGPPTGRPPRQRPADRTPARRRGTTSSTGLIAKIVLLGSVVGLALYVTPALVDQSSWVGLVLVWLGTAVILAVYLGPRTLPLKYLLPGTLLLLVFVIYPILSTIQLSTTNFGDGRRNSKAETVATIVANSVQQVPGSKRYVLSVGTEGSVTEGPFTFFLTDPDTRQVLIGTEDGAKPADQGAVTLTGTRVTAAEGYTILNARQVNAASKQLAEIRVPTDKGAIRILGVSSAYEGTATLQYDAASDTLRNTANGETYTVKVIGDSEFFVRADGSKAFDESWQRNIGLANYTKVLSDPNIRNDFARIFVWTVVFATGSVALSFLLGLALAATLNDPRLRGRKLYRSLLLLPYAVPGFISLLVWRSFYNQDFGLINSLTGLNVNWLGDPTAAKIAVLLANLWLGFPYMMLICTGALQAIPSDLKEAAAIDGASGFRAFRSVTFPLLLVAVAPLLVASFAFNFNNINAVFLLTEGGPFDPANPGAGDTDILISYTFRLAFGGSGAQFGFAAAISVLLFVITGLMAAAQFRATRALEEVN
jgi:arabinogalactan oligomer/maltooligosaccharide transport system permease protein